SCCSTEVASYFPVNAPSFIYPLVLGYQEIGGRLEFEYLESKGSLTVLLPSILQMYISMRVVTQFLAVLRPAMLQINGTANIDFARRDTHNLIYTRGVRHVA